jgi:transcriptional regulator with XRE-family HTH domain
MSEVQSMVGAGQYRQTDENASGKPLSIGITVFPMRDKTTERTDYGARVHEARTDAKMTQTALAAAIGMSQGSLAQLEVSGQSSGKTVQIAAATGVRAAWLATGKLPKRDVDAEPPPAARQVASERVTHYLVGKPDARDWRQVAISLAAALEESGTDVTVKQFIKLVETTHQKLNS